MTTNTKELLNFDKSFNVGVLAGVDEAGRGPLAGPVVCACCCLTLNENSFMVDLNNLNMIGYITLFIVGMISAATMVIPGISGSLVLMLLGYYEPVINTIKDLTNFSNLSHNILILAPFGIGIIVGIVLVAKLIEFLLKRYPIKTYYGVLGFVLASLVAIIKPIIGLKVSIIEIVIAVILVIIGSIIAYKLGDK